MLLVLLFALFQSTSAAQIESNLHERTHLSLTIYNEDLCVVSETRRINLQAGEGRIRFWDVPRQIQPSSISVRSDKIGGGFEINEQSFEFRSLDRNSLMNAYVGKSLKLIDWNQFKDTKRVTDAILLSNANGPVYQIGTEVYLDHPGTVVLPELPAGFSEKPSLTWSYSTKGNGPVQIPVSYITSGIGWQADYTLVLNEQGRGASLAGWITATNHSGTDFENADIVFVAGKPNVEESSPEPAMLRLGKVMMDAAAEPAASRERPAFEYHVIPLGHKADLLAEQIKQFALLSVQDIRVRKELILGGAKTQFILPYRVQENNKVPLDVFVRLQNDKENRLGIPLAQGTIRVYQRDPQGADLFLGEDRLSHTPKGQELKIQVGKSFDVTAERKQTDFREVSTRLYESEWEIIFRNAKDEAVDVVLIEPLYGNWKVLSSTPKFKKLDAFTIRFEENVPARKGAMIRYRIQVGLE